MRSLFRNKVFIIVSLLAVLLLSLSYLERESNKSKGSSQLEDSKPPIELLAERDRILQDIESKKGEGYQRYSVTSEDIQDKIIVVYHDKFNGEPTRKGLRDFGGILVVKVNNVGVPHVEWEVRSDMFRDIPFKLEVRDITNDGNNEILSWWGAGVRLDSYILWIYSWTGETFRLISPLISLGKRIDVSETEDPTIYDSEFGGSAVKVDDIDDDSIDEVIVENIIPTKRDPDLPYAASILEADRLTKIYKWNGKEYYLWQEKREKIE